MCASYTESKISHCLHFLSTHQPVVERKNSKESVIARKETRNPVVATNFIQYIDRDYYLLSELNNFYFREIMQVLCLRKSYDCL